MSKAELLSPGLEPMDLGPGDVEKMFGPATTPLERLRAAGNVEENPAEMGGGEQVNPVEDYFAKMAAIPDGLKRLQDFLEVQQKANLAETAVIAIKNTPGLTFGEMKRVVAAIQTGQGKKPVEQLVREARQRVLPWQKEQHQLEIEKILNLDSARQRNKGELVAVNFLTELKETLVSRHGNDLEKQGATLRNLYDKLRKDDALGFSPNIELIPPGADISTLLSLLKSMLQGNGG